MDKNFILFDLDGTITDPKEGITKSVQYSLKSFGIDVECDDLLAFIGPPLKDSFMKYYGFSEDDAVKAIEKYREYFTDKGIYENVLYDGMVQLLKNLCCNGKKIILATSKPTVFAERILKYFEIDSYFSFVAGSELDGRRSKKGEVIRYAFDCMSITEPEKAIMIGDRELDIIGAKENGIESIGLLFGYGSRQELENAGATYLAESVDELSNLLNAFHI